MKKYTIINISANNLKIVPPRIPTIEPNPERIACFISIPRRSSAADAPNAACLLPPNRILLNIKFYS